MTLLNDKIYNIDTYANNRTVKKYELTQPTTGLVVFQDYFKNNDFWYCSFTTADSFKFFSLCNIMGPKIYQSVLDKKTTIVLDLSFEPFLDSIDSIYQYVIKGNNIPPSQIIFMSNMYDAREYNKQAAIKFNSDPIRIFYFSALEYMVNYYIDKINSPSLTVKWYEKKFINLNRRWRLHRPLLTLLLYHRNLIKKGYISFGPCEGHDSWDKVWKLMTINAIGNEEITKAIKSSYRIKKMPPLYLDTDDLDVNRPELDTTLDKYYANSYFSVVSETTFFCKKFELSSRFLTEKTYKAIIMKHPFVLVTIPKTLEVLKELGYKTFSPWINESYDQEIDDNKRMIMILNEIERLSNFSPSELKNFLINVIPICDYNYNILKNKKNFLYEMN